MVFWRYRVYYEFVHPTDPGLNRNGSIEELTDFDDSFEASRAGQQTLDDLFTTIGYLNLRLVIFSFWFGYDGANFCRCPMRG